MYIRIVRADKPTYWYADHVGNVYKVSSYIAGWGYQTELGFVEEGDAIFFEDLKQVPDECLDLMIRTILDEMKRRRFERLQASLRGSDEH